MADLVYYTIDGVSLSAVNCPAGCNHATPPDGVCLGCQPFPTERRCDTCRIRGGLPTTTTTVTPGPINDQPTEPMQPLNFRTPPGNGPYGEPQARCERTHWEPYPLHQFQMPPVRETRPQFVPVAICQRVLDSIGQSDLEFAEAIEALAAFIDPPNNNSGARAPIQGPS